MMNFIRQKLLLSLTLFVAISPLKATMSDWFLKNYKVLAATTAGVSIVGRGIWAKYVQNKIIKSYQLPNKIKVGIIENRGAQPTMEDMHAVYESNRGTIVGIYDGHRGSLVTQWLKNNFAKRLADSLDSLPPSFWYPSFWSIFFKGKQAALKQVALKNPAKNINSLFLKVDKELLNNHELGCYYDGSTAICAIINNQDLTIAHVGDSRAVLVTDAGYRDLTKDHTPKDDAEKTMISKAAGTVIGGTVIVDREQRAISRAFGYKRYKEVGVSADPDVLRLVTTDQDKYVIIASNGIWEAIESEEAANIVRNNMHKDPKEIAREILIRAAIAPIERGIASASLTQEHKLLKKHLILKANLPPENDPNYQAAIEETVKNWVWYKNGSHQLKYWRWQNLRDTNREKFIEKALACAHDNQTVAVVPLT